MSSYESLAQYYDELTGDVDYSAWADYCEKHFARANRPIHTVLDLACGTGTLTCLLAGRGYEMIGVDQSEEMLAEAAEKAAGLPDNRPIFLHQSMERLDLYGTIDACVCALDSVNYVTRPAALRRAFERVHLFLMPGGLFLFDINSPDKLRGLDGQMYMDEAEDVCCIWRAEYSRKRRICSYGFDLFCLEENGLWRREREEHEEYAYEPEELAEFLRAAGFWKVQVYGDRKLRSPRPGEERLFIAARKDPKWQMKSFES
ncbi:MAG: class I SAM-dependent methyltransferase [Oscillospiraceae bacterium]|nr:class I SAM-dependent methyltransferase [Oscillospiraceae bacterium]